MSARPLPAIDLVRFGCALMVVAHHYGTVFALAPQPFADRAAVPAGWAGATWAGWVGVELFFVVSGYVIAASAQRGSAAAFATRRALRLVPAAWLCATLTTALALAAAIAPPGELAGRWASSILFWPLGDQADHVYWTLGVECAFYLLVAAGLASRAGARAVEPIGLALALAGAGFWWWRGGAAAPASLGRAADLLLLAHGGCFAVGIALSAAARGGWSAARAATLALGLLAAGWEIAAQARYLGVGLGLAAGPAAPLALFAAGVAAVALAHRVALPPRLARPLAAAGLATYPLYLVHHRAGAIVLTALHAAGVPPAAAVALTLAAMLALAFAIAGAAEPWLRARLAAALSRSRAPAPDRRPSASPRAG